MLHTNWLSHARDCCASLIPISALLLLVAAPARASTVYDFSSGGGTTHFAWGTYTDDWASDLDGQRRKTPELGTEVTSVQIDAYARLAASDATGGDEDVNRYWNPQPSAGDESTLIVEFNIAEDPGDVTQLDVLWEGYPDDGQGRLYIWSYAAGNWSDGAGATGENNFIDAGLGGITDFVLSGSLTSNVSDYISGTGQITLLIYCVLEQENSFHDYVSVTVTATTPVPAMSDGVQIVLVLLLSVIGIAGVADLRRSRA